MAADTLRAGDDVYDRVRAAILDGEFAPGAIVSQVSLAGQLGISRTPLREALRRLQSEGLVEGEPNRRVRIAALTARGLEELCVMRVTLEAEAVRLSVPMMTPTDIANLEGHMAEMAHFADEKAYDLWTVPHSKFHRGLTQHAGASVNFYLSQMFDHAERYRRLHIGLAPTAWATPQHRQILDACKVGDRDRAGSLIGAHLAGVGFELLELLDPEYRPEQLEQALADVGATMPMPPRRSRRRRST